MVPDGATNRDKWRGFGPDWWIQPGQKAPAYIPFLPPPPEPFSSVFLLFLAQVGGVLAYFIHDL